MEAKISDNLKEIHSNELEMMEYIDKVLSKNKVWYSLSYGSVLGAVRHKGFIPWDDDIDLMINLKDVTLVRKILIENLPKNMVLESYHHDTTSSHDVLKYKNNQGHIDLYPLIGTPNDEKQRSDFIKKIHYTNRILRAKTAKVARARGLIRKTALLMTKAFLMLVPNSLIRKIYRNLENKYHVADSEFLTVLAADGGSREYVRKESLDNMIKIPFENLMLPVMENYKEYLLDLYGETYMTPIKR